MAVTPARRRSPGLPWTTILLVFVVLVAGSALVALALGQTLRVPWPGGPLVLSFVDEAEGGPPAGYVAVPVSGRAIPAYHRLTRDDIWDLQRNTIAVTYFTPEQVEQTGVFTTLAEVLGRVLEDPKPKGYVFTERDFLPKGTRPGLTAGIPQGKRALRVDVSRIEGLIGLYPGDRFDLIGSVPVELGDDVTSGVSGAFASQLKLQTALGALGQQARVTPLVTNGVVVTPMETRSVPMAVSSLTQGSITRTRPVQEIVIALAPEEVAPLAEALALETRLLCVPRSGQPGSDDEEALPSRDPTHPLWGGGKGGDGSGGMRMIETIDGDERSFQPVPRGEGS